MQNIANAADARIDSFAAWLSAKNVTDLVITAVFIVVVIIACAILAHLAHRGIVRLLSRNGSHVPNVTIFVNITRGAIWFVGACIVLTTGFNVDISALLAALGIGGLALSLGMQDTLSNLISGLQLSTANIVKEGDYVRCGEVEGVVTDITWRHTCIEGFRGERSVVPNKVASNAALTVLPAARRVKVPITLPFETAGQLHDVHEVDAACTRIAEAVRTALESPQPDGMGLALDSSPVVLFRGTGEYALLADCAVWVSEGQQFQRPEVEDAIVRAAAGTVSSGFGK